jgi:hypothetical protein
VADVGVPPAVVLSLVRRFCQFVGSLDHFFLAVFRFFLFNQHAIHLQQGFLETLRAVREIGSCGFVWLGLCGRNRKGGTIQAYQKNSLTS